MNYETYEGLTPTFWLDKVRGIGYKSDAYLKEVIVFGVRHR